MSATAKECKLEIIEACTADEVVVTTQRCLQAILTWEATTVKPTASKGSAGLKQQQ